MKEVATKDKVAVKKIPNVKQSEKTNNLTEIAFLAECQVATAYDTSCPIIHAIASKYLWISLCV